MNKHHNKRATKAQLDPTAPTTTTSAAVATGDNDDNGQMVSAEDIRLCAYLKWEAAGKPTGDGVPFWLEAEQELVNGKAERPVQQEAWHGHHEHERLEADKKAIKEGDVSVDSHYRDNNRMFQSHGERGHRHGGSG